MEIEPNYGDEPILADYKRYLESVFEEELTWGQFWGAVADIHRWDEQLTINTKRSQDGKTITLLS